MPLSAKGRGGKLRRVALHQPSQCYGRQAFAHLHICIFSPRDFPILQEPVFYNHSSGFGGRPCPLLDNREKNDPGNFLFIKAAPLPGHGYFFRGAGDITQLHYQVCCGGEGYAFAGRSDKETRDKRPLPLFQESDVCRRNADVDRRICFI